MGGRDSLSRDQTIDILLLLPQHGDDDDGGGGGWRAVPGSRRFGGRLLAKSFNPN